MKELETILKEHASRYPLMEPRDAVKLIYQNEFGGGHLIRDEQACLDYLRREYASVKKDAAAPLYEEIGNGIVRVNLAAVKPDALEQLGADFIRSAALHKGTVERFEEKLKVLSRAAEEGLFSFSLQELEEFLEGYKASGYPAVSHSAAYREAYGPAYRVILRKR